MGRTTIFLLSYVACCMGTGSISLAPVAESRPSDRSKLADDIEQLTRTVLSDPLDSTAIARLTELREREQQQRRQALSGLPEGLQGYLDGKVTTARAGVTQAVQSPYVVDLASHVLGAPLEEVVRGRLEPAVCPMCGGTSRADCKRCHGSGVQPCRACGGDGFSRDNKGRRSVGVAIPCEQCKGAGAVPCPHCSGRGVVACEKCAMPAGHAADKPGPKPAQIEAIKKLIGLARYLRDGGLDFYSPRALTCSPKLAK